MPPYQSIFPQSTPGGITHQHFPKDTRVELTQPTTREAGVCHVNTGGVFASGGTEGDGGSAGGEDFSIERAVSDALATVQSSSPSCESWVDFWFFIPRVW